jgi:hypothetical protein
VSMKVYVLVDYIRDEFIEYAEFHHCGTWSNEKEYCKYCEYSDEILIEPLEIRWDPGSNKIGDFSWFGYTVVIQDRVKEFLMKNDYKCEFGKVIVKEPKEKKNKLKSVPFPYEGPMLHWLKSVPYINLDINASGLEVKRDCDICGRFAYKFKMDDIVISKSEINDLKMFGIKQFWRSGAIYITERSLDEIMSNNFTNFRYYEAGHVASK